MARFLSPPIRWYGAKVKLVAKWLRLGLPRHEVYVESHGGSGALLFAKKPSPIEVYNDLNPKIVNLYRTVADEHSCRLLQEQLLKMEFTEAEYLRACAFCDEYDGGSSLEFARQFYIASNMNDEFDGSDSIALAAAFYIASNMGKNGHAKCHGSSGWSDKVASKRRQQVHNKALRLMEHHARLKNVVICNENAAAVIARYDSPTTFTYSDPPYIPSTLTHGSDYPYEYGMETEDHIELLKQFMKCKGMVALSGYDCTTKGEPVTLYDELLCRWQKFYWMVHLSAGARPGKPTRKRKECVWANPAFLAAVGAVAA